MARSPREPALPSPLAPAIARYVRAQGGDAALALRRAGLDPDTEARDEAPLAIDALEALIDAAGDALGEPFVALRLPAEMPFRRYVLAELAARASGTVGEALERLARYGALVHPRLSLALERAPTEARWRLRTPGQPRGYGRHVHELALALGLVSARRESGLGLAATRAWFAHARPPELAPLARFFGTDALAFGCTDSGFALAPEALAAPTRAGDARLLATVDALAARAVRELGPDAPRFSALVAARVRAALPASAAVEATARALRMSPRTLQRRLADDGTSFSALLDAVRDELAREWLAADDATIAAVAARLGFADVATFGRAFKRWTGMPPGAWRRR